MLPQEPKRFTPEFKIKKFEIIIEVYENSQTITVNHMEEDKSYLSGSDWCIGNSKDNAYL